jgi:hypothetical protein
VSAVGFRFFAKVFEEAADGASRSGGKLDDSIEAREVLFFSRGEKTMQSRGDLAGTLLFGLGK